MRRLNVFGVAEQKSRDARCSSPLPHPPVPSTHPLSQPPGPSESASPGGHLEALTFQARARARVSAARGMLAAGPQAPEIKRLPRAAALAENPRSPEGPSQLPENESVYARHANRFVGL